MPLTSAGELKVVPSADLGGLGPREGTPVSYNWATSSILPALVSWFFTLLLLLVPSNRTGSAWLIWLPLLLIVAVMWSVLNMALTFLPSMLLDWLLEVVRALAFGIASVWLLANHLGRRHRFLSFLGILGTLAAFSALSYVVRQDWQSGVTEAVQMAIILGLSVLAVSVALSLTGLSCRRRYRPVALTFWLIAWLLVAWLVIVLPFALIALIASGGGAEIWGQVLIAVLTAAGLNFVILLPFLILSFVSPFYRERLKDLLNLGQEKPPIITAVPAASPA